MTDRVVASYLQNHRVEPPVPTPQPALATGAKPPVKLKNEKEKDIRKLSPLVFNKPYAKMLLDEHIRSLSDQHSKRKESMKKDTEAGSKAEVAEARTMLSALAFTDVSKAADPSVDKSVELLVPFFQSLLAYRSTVLKAKEREMRRDIEIGRGSETAMKASLLKIAAMKIPVQWEITALRMLEGDAGRLPGQMTATQPTFLPLRIFAPPRVGKSALGLLVASLARRMGLKMLYSVSPDKDQPIKEAQAKLKVLGWRRDVTSRNRKGGMNFAAWKVEDVPAPKKCAPKLQYFDMIYYSSDVASDAQRVGAMLAEWRRTEVVVLHFRDEAQSLAKTLDNPQAARHKRFVPPPPLLAYLREYYGNLFGISCNITATHFPTLLEPMWGFFGSVDQGVDAGISLRKLPEVADLSRRIGTFGLPELVPALEPKISEGYAGVESLVQWKYSPVDEDGRPIIEGGKVVESYGVYLSAGTKSVFDMDKGFEYAGSLITASSTLTPKEEQDADQEAANMSAEEAAAAAAAAAQVKAAAADGEEVTKTKTKKKELTPKEKENITKLEKKINALNLQMERKDRSDEQALALRRSNRKKKTQLEGNRDELKKAIKELEQELEARKAQRAAHDSVDTKLAEKKKELEQNEELEAARIVEEPQTALLKQDDDTDDEGPPKGEGDDDPGDEDYLALLAKQKKAANDAAKRRMQEVLLLRDIKYIHAHFDDFLDAESVPNVPSRDSVVMDGTTEPPPTPDTDKPAATIIPTYIGALNQNSADAGMASFVRTFGKRALLKRKGCAFLLFTSAVKNQNGFGGGPQSRSKHAGKIDLMPGTATDGATFEHVNIESKDGKGSGKPKGGKGSGDDDNKTSVVLAISHPTSNKDGEPMFYIRRAKDAGQAISFVKDTLPNIPGWEGRTVEKFAILGYAANSFEP